MYYNISKFRLWVLWVVLKCGPTDLCYMYFVVVGGCAQSAEEAPNDSSYFVEDHVVFKVLGLLRSQEFYLLTSAQIFFIPQDFETTIE